MGLKHEQYTRRLVLEDKLEGCEKRDMGHYFKWFIPVASIEAYKARTATRAGTRRFILKMAPELESKVREALDQLDIDYSLELAYQGKETTSG